MHDSYEIVRLNLEESLADIGSDIPAIWKVVRGYIFWPFLLLAAVS